jgi:hypothetical protein
VAWTLISGASVFGIESDFATGIDVTGAALNFSNSSVCGERHSASSSLVNFQNAFEIAMLIAGGALERVSDLAICGRPSLLATAATRPAMAVSIERSALVQGAGEAFDLQADAQRTLLRDRHIVPMTRAVAGEHGGDVTLDQVRVELLPGTAAQFGESFFARLGRWYGRSEDHGVEGVGDREDARAQWDVAPVGSRGFSGLPPNHAWCVRTISVSTCEPNAAEMISTPIWSCVRMTSIPRRSAAGLEQDRVGHAELADVVQHRRHFQDEAVVDRHEALGGGDADVGDALASARRWRSRGGRARS